MPIKDCPRVNLTIRKIEQRAIEEDGKKVITGFIPYNKRSVNMGWAGEEYEVLSPGCFKKTLADKNEVRAFFNHDDSKVLGNTKSGTLVLTDTPEGLECRCELPNTSYANDLYEVIKRGDCRTMSFGMYIVKRTFEDKGDTTISTINDAALDEVSFGVAYPAYPQTSSETVERSFKALKVEDMTDNMKKSILNLAEEIRSTDGTNQQPAGIDTEYSAETPAPIVQDNSAEEEMKRKAEEEAMAIAKAEADAFEFTESLY